MIFLLFLLFLPLSLPLKIAERVVFPTSLKGNKTVTWYRRPQFPEGQGYFAHQVVNESCPRFATQPLSKRFGLGHKFGNYIFGMNLVSPLCFHALTSDEVLLQGLEL
jgi:hypothetical protein